MNELAFRCMDTDVRLLGSPGAPLDAARAAVEELAARLTRFDPGSELSALNADPRPVVPASPVLRAAVQAALAGARETRGLADPTLLGALERAGYERSLAGRPRADLAAALAAAPGRRPARPSGVRAWARVRMSARGIARPPGLRLDLGGSAKGLAADLACSLLAPDGPAAADCGGDLRVTGDHEVLVRHPLSGEVAHVLGVSDAAVASSGIDARVWWTAAGEPAHHLLDPATGGPAWTGVVSATAIAPTATGAEALAKAAVLSGPDGGRRILAEHGGVLVLDDGGVDVVAAGATPAAGAIA